MRVLRVITRLNIGGPSKQVLLLNKMFDGVVHEQRVVIGQVQDSEIEIDHSEISDVVKIKSLKRGINPIFDFFALIKLIGVIRNYQPDVIHTHLSKAWTLVIVAKFLTNSKIKVIHTFHGHILHSYFPRILASWLVKIQQCLASRTDVLVAVNETTKEELLVAGIGEKTSFLVITPGFDVLPKLDKQLSRQRFGLQPEYFSVGFIGRLEPIKRPDLLAAVINDVTSKHERVQFLICGGGSLYHEFKIQVNRENVHCIPWMEDISPIYSALDLMILTSDNEGSPLTIIEAGKMGIPTLARSVGGVPSLINHGVNGYLTGNLPSDFVDTFSKILEGPKDFEKVCAQTQKEFVSNYELSTFLDAYRNLYHIES